MRQNAALTNAELGWYYVRKGLQASVSRCLRRPLQHRFPWAAHQRPEPDWEHVDRALESLDVRLVDYTVDVGAYARWVEEAHYPQLAYLANREEKFLEHVISVDLLGVQSPGTLVDVASCRSFFPEIMRRRGFRVIAQDLSYPAGLHGDTLGGDAAAMPLPDSSVDGVTLHCSFEHFEGDADTRFATNIARLLKPGARAVILPLYLSERFAIESDPLVSAGRIPVDEGATLFASFGYTNRFGRHYDTQALSRRVLEPAAKAELEASIVRIRGAKAVSNGCYVRYALVLQRPMS